MKFTYDGREFELEEKVEEFEMDLPVLKWEPTFWGRVRYWLTGKKLVDDYKPANDGPKYMSNVMGRIQLVGRIINGPIPPLGTVLNIESHEFKGVLIVGTDGQVQSAGAYTIPTEIHS